MVDNLQEDIMSYGVFMMLSKFTILIVLCLDFWVWFLYCSFKSVCTSIVKNCAICACL